MEEKTPSNGSAKLSLAEIDLPAGKGPVAHLVQLRDPRDVEAHFEGLAKQLKNVGQTNAMRCLSEDERKGAGAKNLLSCPLQELYQVSRRG
jgi:hypothetical protein